MLWYKDLQVLRINQIRTPGEGLPLGREVPGRGRSLLPVFHLHSADSETVIECYT